MKTKVIMTSMSPELEKEFNAFLKSEGLLSMYKMLPPPMKNEIINLFLNHKKEKENNGN